jgi:hypothetical protein
MSYQWGLACCIGVLLACSLEMSQLSHFTRQADRYISLFTIAFLAYIGALWLLRRVYIPVGLIIGIALLLRIPLWATEPTLSSDVWRYLWDGRLVAQGVSPYAERVDSPTLAEFRTELHPKIDHQWMASPYPPMAQAVFGLTYALWPESPRAMQIAFTFFDLATIYLLALLLQSFNKPPQWAVFYAWHPLLVVESAHGAHVDSLMTCLILATIWATQHKRAYQAAFWLALATLTKFIPALLLPAVIQRWGWRAFMLYIGIVGVIFMPFILLDGLADDGTGVFGAAQIYSQQWKTNDGLFYWLVEGLRLHTSDPLGLGHWIVRAVLASLGLGILLRKPADLIWPMVGLISAYLLLIFAMFPWYLTWLLALLPLLPHPTRWSTRLFILAWLYFSWAVNLSYLFYLDPARPGELMWVRYVEYLPLYGGLGLAALVQVGPHLLKFLPKHHAQHQEAAHSE